MIRPQRNDFAVSVMSPILRLVAVGAFFTMGIAGEAATAPLPTDELFQTSFEGGEVATFKQRSEGDVVMNATGTASVTSQFAHTGKQCLRMLGDENNSLTLTVPKSMQKLKGLSFHAERWTRRDPFAFSVEVEQGGQWVKLADLSEVVVVGARFLSHVRLPIHGDGETTAIRFSVTAASQSGLLLDDLVFHATIPENPTSTRSVVLPNEPLELVSSQPLFVSGTNDTHTFRIPAIATATNGNLIVACDARRKNSADLVHQRTIDIVFRRSEDHGRTWSPMKVLDTFNEEGCSDPSLVVDEVTGDIFCFYNLMSSDKASKEYRFIVQKSSDHGKTWRDAVDFTDQVAGPELKDAFKFITSGRGIQLRDGTLIHNYVQVGKGATLFASRDHGTTWKRLSDVSPGDESKVVQLHDGSLMVNSRRLPGQRFVHRSIDGGATWKTTEFDLPDPRCNACIIQYTAKRDGFAKDRLIFCNAASNKGRRNLAVRISYDAGQTWSDGKVIDSGPSAYSEITILSDGSFGVLYEPGYKEVRFARFTLEALTDGHDTLIKPFTVPTKSPRQ